MEGWNVEKKTGDMKVYWQKVEKLKSISLRFETVLDIPLFNLLSLFYETDLFPKIIPFCEDSTPIAQLSRARKMFHMVYNAPILSKRDAIMLGYGIDKLE